MSLCSLLLSLETPNAVRSVAWRLDIQVTSKGSDQTAYAPGWFGPLLVGQTTLLEISCYSSFV